MEGRRIELDIRIILAGWRSGVRDFRAGRIDWGPQSLRLISHEAMRLLDRVEPKLGAADGELRSQLASARQEIVEAMHVAESQESG